MVGTLSSDLLALSLVRGQEEMSPQTPRMRLLYGMAEESKDSSEIRKYPKYYVSS